jgi:hypothetical protein
MMFTEETCSYVPEPVQGHFANNKSREGGMGWIPMAQFEVQWGSYIPFLKGAKIFWLILPLIFKCLFTAGATKHDIKNNIHIIIIFVTDNIYL